MTSETASVKSAIKTGTAWPAIIKVALTLLVLVELAAFMYGLFFAMLAAAPLQSMIADAQISNAIDFENRLLGLTLAPLAYAILAAIAPLVGWWIYSRVDKPQQDAVGWGGASLFAVTYVLIGMFNAGVLARMGLVISALSTVLGLGIIILYVMLFMTAGFLTAALFKAKL